MFTSIITKFDTCCGIVVNFLLNKQKSSAWKLKFLKKSSFKFLTNDSLFLSSQLYFKVPLIERNFIYLNEETSAIGSNDKAGDLEILKLIFF